MGRDRNIQANAVGPALGGARLGEKRAVPANAAIGSDVRTVAGPGYRGTRLSHQASGPVLTGGVRLTRNRRFVIEDHVSCAPPPNRIGFFVDITA